MSIVVEHDKRRRAILEKALDVFVDEGFENVTCQKIADRCDITRTTLYIYFKNKREIFNFSIKQFLGELEDNIVKIKDAKNISHTDKLIQVITVIFERLQENHRLLSVIMNYLIHISKSDSDPDYRVRKRTVRLRHILAGVLIEGVKAGEFVPRLNIKNAKELLYSFLEAAVFRMVILRRSSVEELKDAMKLVVQLFVLKAD